MLLVNEKVKVHQVLVVGERLELVFVCNLEWHSGVLVCSV